MACGPFCALWSGNYAKICAIITCLTAAKVLLVPSYYSTDFEVHRNWMAITYNLPFKMWYHEHTSQWTLDYPPFFAWFELGLSKVAQYVEPQMLQIARDGYRSPATLIFQRCTVMATDITLVLATLWHCSGQGDKAWPTVWLVLANAGLLIVDHIHFQYNGFMLGVLVASIVAMQRGRVLLSGLLFAVLLNFKHLYLVLAPVYFVLILRGWCWAGQRFRWGRFASMAAVVLGVFACSLGPVIVTGQLQALLSRLFPFGRGLLHAYWAANAWAIYAAADKVVALCLRRFGFTSPHESASLTGGLVQVSHFASLPQISPAVAMLCVVVSMLPCLVALWRVPDMRNTHRHVAYAALCGFMFGYHVHEKAALTVTVALALGATSSRKAAGEYLVLSTVAHFAMHPLLFQSQEYPIKMLIIAGGAVMTCVALKSHQARQRQERHLVSTSSGTTDSSSLAAGAPLLHRTHGDVLNLLSARQGSYLAGLVVLEIVCHVALPSLVGARFPFLPLMLTSLYCAAGVMWAWASMFLEYLSLACAVKDKEL